MLQSTGDKLVRIFFIQKFEALSVSVCALYLWIAIMSKPAGLEWPLLFSRTGMPFFVMLMISLTSWRMNMRAESSLAFKTAHYHFYSIHAAIQDFVMTLCVGAFAVYALFFYLATPWFIAACVAVSAILIWRFRSANRIFRWALNMKNMGVVSYEEAVPDNTLTSLLCVLTRFFAIGYTIYYIAI